MLRVGNLPSQILNCVRMDHKSRSQKSLNGANFAYFFNLNSELFWIKLICITWVFIGIKSEEFEYKAATVLVTVYKTVLISR